MTYNFIDVARLPSDDDNVAIATQRLDAGTQIRHNDNRLLLSPYSVGRSSICHTNLLMKAHRYYHGVCPLVMLHN